MLIIKTKKKKKKKKKKGWVDKTFAYYFAYGGDHNFKGKKWFTCTTTGGPENVYKDQIGTTVIFNYFFFFWFFYDLKH